MLLTELSAVAILYIHVVNCHKVSFVITEQHNFSLLLTCVCVTGEVLDNKNCSHVGFSQGTSWVHLSQ